MSAETIRECYLWGKTHGPGSFSPNGHRMIELLNWAKRRNQRLALVVAAGAVVAAGCGSGVKQSEPQDPATARMKTLAVVYGRYVARHRGQLPTDKTALKTFMRTEGKELVAERAVTNIDELFVSPRDGKPLVVTYANAAAGRQMKPDMVVAYEATGVGGMRMIAFSRGTVVEADQSTFDKLDIAPEARNGGTPRTGASGN